MSSYEKLGEDDLTLHHAMQEGVHDAVSYSIRYAALGLAALAAAAVLLGPRTGEKILKKLLGG